MLSNQQKNKLSVKRIIALIVIFIVVSVAWGVLGGSMHVRSETFNRALMGEVVSLWGGEQRQSEPLFYYQEERDVKISEKEFSKEITEKYIVPAKHNITVDFDLEHRKKGLEWYSTYKVDFLGEYVVINALEEEKIYYVAFAFPGQQALYDAFSLFIDGEKQSDLSFENGKVVQSFSLAPKEMKEIKVAYTSQGLDEWHYLFAERITEIKHSPFAADNSYNSSSVNQVQNFSLVMNTDFDDIDFPASTLSPSSKEKTNEGWKLAWQYDDLISGLNIGLKMPQKLNPGPFVARLSFFAPVSLLFFFVVIFFITVLRDIDIHPMNYLFISAAFFSFHLLLAYLVDHAAILLSFIISAIVSIFLVISYLRLAVGLKFALREAALAQLVYLIFFSYSFFYEGYTGLIITICSILTLFILMQLTGRIKWSERFNE